MAGTVFAVAIVSKQALSNAMTMEKKGADKGDEHSSAQWNVRISVTKLKIVEIKEHLE